MDTMLLATLSIATMSAALAISLSMRHKKSVVDEPQQHMTTLLLGHTCETNA